MVNVQGDTFRTSTAIPQLPEGTHVYYRITAFAPNGDSARTERLMYLVKPGILCNASGAIGTSFDFIDTVRVGTLNNATGQDYYGDFRTTFTDLYRDSTYTLMTSLNYSFPLDSMFLWVDWNDDGDVQQPGEQIIMSALDADHKSYATFTVPHVPSIPDTVVMRVRCMYDLNPVADPCDDYYGEVEDYSIVLRDVVIVGAASDYRRELQLFPNPASETVIVRWNMAAPEAVVRLWDVQGRIVASNVGTRGECQLHLSDLAQGVYTVEVETQLGIQRARLAITR
jgi:hypothetical protein